MERLMNVAHKVDDEAQSLRLCILVVAGLEYVDVVLESFDDVLRIRRGQVGTWRKWFIDEVKRFERVEFRKGPQIVGPVRSVNEVCAFSGDRAGIYLDRQQLDRLCSGFRI